MSLFVITSFIWIHFLIDYFIDPTYIKSYMSDFKQQVVHATMYGIAFSMFGLYFGLVMIILNFLLNLFVEYAMSASRDIIPGRNLPYVLKIIRGVDQMLLLTSLFIVYFIFLQFNILGPSIF